MDEGKIFFFMHDFLGQALSIDDGKAKNQSKQKVCSLGKAGCAERRQTSPQPWLPIVRLGADGKVPSGRSRPSRCDDAVRKIAATHACFPHGGDVCRGARVAPYRVRNVAARIDRRRGRVSTEERASGDAGVCRFAGAPSSNGAWYAMRRKAVSSETTHAAIAAFLDAHCAHTLPNDVGPLLGRLASMQDLPRAGASAQRQWHEAVSLALTGQATARRH